MQFVTFLLSRKYFIAILGGGVLVLGGILFYKDIQNVQEKSSYQEYGQEILLRCQDENYRPGCYDRELPKLMDTLSMEEIFEVTKLVQQKDQEYWYCHVLGHELSAQETAKDPEKWKEVVGRCPMGMCSNGCIHGAFQERFRAESLPDAKIAELKPELEGICEKRPAWNATDMEQATCYHALGHLTMYITGADLDTSLVLCQELAKKQDGRDYSDLCFDGAFMQIFQPLEPEDFALVAGKQPKKEELPAFCSTFEGEQHISCWVEAWPLSFNQIMKPEGLVQYCSQLPKEQQNRCYLGLFYVVTAQLRLEEEKVLDYCKNIPERKAQCFANAASRMIETDAQLAQRAARVCGVADSLGMGTPCYEELLVYSTYNFHPGSEDFLRLCNALPEQWKTQCFSKT